MPEPTPEPVVESIVGPTEAQRRDLDRLLTFVDAIVAIAITLLVLPLVELTSDLDDGRPVLDVLDQHQAQFWAFGLSFVVIARLWFVQHAVMRHATSADGVSARLLVLWAFSIVTLPFPTALVAAAGDDPWSKVLYVGTMIVGVSALAILAMRIKREGRTAEGAVVDDADLHPSQIWINVGLLVLALVLMLTLPVLSYFPLLLLTVDRRVRWLAGLLAR